MNDHKSGSGPRPRKGSRAWSGPMGWLIRPLLSLRSGPAGSQHAGLGIDAARRSGSLKTLRSSSFQRGRDAWAPLGRVALSPGAKTGRVNGPTQFSGVHYVVVGLFILALVGGFLISSGTQLPRLAFGPDSSFRYEGRLLDGGFPISGNCDLRLGLYDADFGGNQVGKTHTATLPLEDGSFAVVLDFGPGQTTIRERFIEIEARCPSGDGLFIPLVRQRLRSGKPFELHGYEVLADLVLPNVDASLLAGEAMYGPDWPAQVESAAQPVVNPGLQADDMLTPGIGRIGSVIAQSKKSVDLTQGHEGSKRIAAIAETSRPSAYPGEKRAAGSKALAGAAPKSKRPSGEGSTEIGNLTPPT